MQFVSDDTVTSWGRIGRRRHLVARPRFASSLREWRPERGTTALAIGCRRSYSDVCLSDGDQLIDMTALSRIQSLDLSNGVLIAEAGLTIDELLRIVVPLGFFVPVTPGTRFVTLGGAVANDVHGKNHHGAGTFGCHVRAVRLLRSDEGHRYVQRDKDAALFAATVGGLGLTGIITHVEVQLQPIRSSQLTVQQSAHHDLDDLCAALEASDGQFEHSVSWIDCSKTGRQLGRGILTVANWSSAGGLVPHARPRHTVPSDRTGALLNSLTLPVLNEAYYRAGMLGAGTSTVHYAPFFYPLDKVMHWNRLYGKRGFFQYQCVVPLEAGREPIRAMLQAIAASGQGSTLAVLKRFGERKSPGLLSFPRPGLTLALDFKNLGSGTEALLARLDEIVASAGGRLYPAKDQRMPPRLFRSGYPELDAFQRQLDPALNSDFWKRMAA